MVTISYSQIAMHNVHSIVHNCATPNRLSLINDWRDDNIQQPHQQFEALYEHAKFAQVELNQLIKKSALRTDCHAILPWPKVSNTCPTKNHNGTAWQIRSINGSRTWLNYCY